MDSVFYFKTPKICTGISEGITYYGPKIIDLLRKNSIPHLGWVNVYDDKDFMIIKLLIDPSVISSLNASVLKDSLSLGENIEDCRKNLSKDSLNQRVSWETFSENKIGGF